MKVGDEPTYLGSMLLYSTTPSPLSLVEIKDAILTRLRQDAILLPSP